MNAVISMQKKQIKILQNEILIALVSNITYNKQEARRLLSEIQKEKEEIWEKKQYFLMQTELSVI